MEVHSLYIHVPFCLSRCNYCDFNTYAGMGQHIDGYVKAVCKEIEYLSQPIDMEIPIHTIYFGGGTPSLLSAYHLEKILTLINQQFQVGEKLEITLEANPGTVSCKYFHDIHSLGINRISLGMQSAIPEELRLLGRMHDVFDVIQAVNWARQAGFDNLNLDLIFGLPEQGMKTWETSVNFALKLNPEHLSLYALSVEQGTMMQRWLDRGLLNEIDPDLAADMYEWAGDRLEAAGFEQYEISNWARREHEGILACRHNLQYWRNHPYIGLGAGAHGYAGGLRIANETSIMGYIDMINNGIRREFPRSPATISEEFIDQKNEIAETMMMGLRLTSEGVSAIEFEKRFVKNLLQVYPKEIGELTRLRLLEWAGDALRITKKGRILGNQVFMRFV